VTTIALICARGGSKGLPGKNIRLFAGKPLIAWAIDHAKAVARIDRVLVSTDCPVIASIARTFDAEVPFMRPAELARDDSPEWLAWRHAIEYLREVDGVYPERFVSVPATAPLRLPQDIDNCLDDYERGGADMVVTVTDAHRSPYFNMVTRDESGVVQLVIQPQGQVFRRQDAPVVYDMTTVAYVTSPAFILGHDRVFAGTVRAVYVPPERAPDIDTELDFRFAEYLLQSRTST
jgi:CMP-N-acetylneuraminic acid synthetase